MADVKIPKMLHKMSLATQKAWYKKQGMEMPSASKPAEAEGKSAAAAKKIKVAPRKTMEVRPGSIRAINAARQQAYLAKGGRQPIGATGSGGHSVTAGSNMSTAKGIIAGIKAGYNPKVSLNPYQGETEKDKKKKVAESNGEYNKFGQPRPGSMDIDPKAGDTPPKYTKRKPAQYKPQKEETEMNEVSKKEAEAVLGGPTREKPKGPAGKLPLGYRLARAAARKAMKAGLKKEEVAVDEAKKPDASMVMTNQLRNKMISDKDKRTLGKVADLMAAQKKLDKKNMKEESEMQYIEEKLTAADPASKWISDFVKSDNPKFAGKSKKERIQQALGAYYAAKRGTNEEAEQVDEVTGYEGVKDRTDMIKRAAAMNRMGKGVFLSRVKARAAEMKKEKAGKELAKEEAELEEGYMGKGNHKPGWMLKADPKLAKKIKAKTDLAKKRQATYGNPAAGKSVKEEVGGKTPETDTEVELAKKHGNPKKITYGDVVKARIEAAKKKALNKGE